VRAFLLSRRGLRSSTRQRTYPIVLLIVPMSDKSAYLDRYAEPDKGWTDRDESRWPVPYWDVDAGMASLYVYDTPEQTLTTRSV